VRKAGGVYYTPKYIVDYIVENTVGKLLEDKTPDRAADLKIVDPACGSGSFLLGAFQYLMDWHEDYYLAHDPEKWTKGRAPALVQTADGDWRLTTEEKKRILVNNIHGVDIDSQAVEVTKLSLLLKVLEEETGQLTLGFERALPDLSDNIKCGNSLIGWDYFEGQLLPDQEEVARVNPFDWEKNFPEVFKQGGFDAVIGNPPYRKERDSKELLIDIKKSKYGELYYQGKMDFWYFFLHRSIDIVRSSGFISFIVPSYWLSSTGASKLIARVEDSCSFIDIVDFSKNKIFEDVSGRHMTFALVKSSKNLPLEYQKFINDGLTSREIENELKSNLKNSERSTLSNSKNIFTSNHKVNLESIKFSGLLLIIDNSSFHLEGKDKEFEVGQGIIEAPDCISNSICKRVKDFSRLGEGVFVISEPKLKQLSLTTKERDFIKKYLAGEDVDRYSINYSSNYVFYISSSDNKYISSHKKEFPNITYHLDNYKKYITSSNKPYGIHRTRDPKFFTQPKIIGKNMFDRPKFSYCEEEYYVNFSFNVIIRNNSNYSLKFLLGLLNSKLGAFWFNIFGKKRGINVDVGVGVLRKFPVVKIDFADLNQCKNYERIIYLVNHMLDLHKRTPQTPFEQEQLEREIAATDAQIDRLVYELYGLTEEEIKIVEGEG
jgi:adenine-specific DNA-methyltransferase